MILKVKILFSLCLLASSSLALSSNVRIAAVRGSAVAKTGVPVIVEAYKKIGIDIKIELFPGERALVMSNSGKLAGELHRIKGIEKRYNNLVQVPVKVNSILGVAFTTNPSIKINSWKDLKGHRLGVVRGIKFVEKNTNGYDNHVVGDYVSAFNLLSKGRVSVVIAPKIVGEVMQKKLGIHPVHQSQPLIRLPLYHYVHKTYSSRVNKLAQVLQKMKKTGEIELLLKKAAKDLISKVKPLAQ